MSWVAEYTEERKRQEAWHAIQPDMCPTKEHIDQLEEAVKKAEKNLKDRLAEIAEAHREYTRAAERTEKMLKRYGVKS